MGGYTGAVGDTDRADEIAVAGGVSIEGATLPGLAGRDLAGDLGTGRIGALTLPKTAGTASPEPLALGRFAINPSTFGADLQGRPAVADFQGGVLYRLAPSALSEP